MPCVPGGYYCGGDKVMGDPDVLYRCDHGDVGTPLEVCMYGCFVHANEDDTCQCTPGGAYCGGDKLDGNSNTLYRCKADGTGSVIMRCPNHCHVNPGQDDTCS